MSRYSHQQRIPAYCSIQVRVDPFFFVSGLSRHWYEFRGQNHRCSPGRVITGPEGPFGKRIHRGISAGGRTRWLDHFNAGYFLALVDGTFELHVQCNGRYRRGANGGFVVHISVRDFGHLVLSPIAESVIDMAVHIVYGVGRVPVGANSVVDIVPFSVLYDIRNGLRHILVRFAEKCRLQTGPLHIMEQGQENQSQSGFEVEGYTRCRRTGAYSPDEDWEMEWRDRGLP